MLKGRCESFSFISTATKEELSLSSQMKEIQRSYLNSSNTRVYLIILFLSSSLCIVSSITLEQFWLIMGQHFMCARPGFERKALCSFYQAKSVIAYD